MVRAETIVDLEDGLHARRGALPFWRKCHFFMKIRCMDDSDLTPQRITRSVPFTVDSDHLTEGRRLAMLMKQMDEMKSYMKNIERGLGVGLERHNKSIEHLTNIVHGGSGSTAASFETKQ